MKYANEVDYWKTGQTRTPEQWIALAVKQLEDHGATNVVTASGDNDGRHCFMMQFMLAGQQHRIIWPVLPVRWTDSESDKRAAKVQAATVLYHEVKHRCVVATRYGSQFGWFAYQQLPDGRTVQQLSSDELMRGVPEVMTPKMLPAPDSFLIEDARNRTA